MLKSPGILPLFSILIFCSSPISANATPQGLAALFQNPKPVKAKAGGKRVEKKLPLLPLSPDYSVYFHAKDLLSKGSDLTTLENAQKQVLAQKMVETTKNLDREFDELFYALELKRAEKYSQKKAWEASLNSFWRAMGGLSTYKWIYYWRAETSKALATVCSRNKKKKDENCLQMAKRVSDAFPKNALETKALRELPAYEPSFTNEASGDRLTQSYSEKLEKDEEAFQEVLQAFLTGKDSDVLKTGKQFITDYPKSILRFRATFLMAETHQKKGDKKEARDLYLSLIDEVPLSFYAIVSSERIGIDLRDRVSKTPIVIDLEALNPNPNEEKTLARAKALFSHKDYEEVGIELESMTRSRSYSTDFLLYLMKFASVTNQNLVSFRLANELIQRRYGGFLNQEFLGLLFPDRYWNEISAESVKNNNVDPILVMSLMKQESGFKASILSSSGALGLMQLMPFTAIDTKKDVVLSSLRDPVQNIAVGEKYFAGLMNIYEGNAPYALAAYNAGPHRVAKWRKEASEDWGMIEWIESIPYKETRDYVMAILRNRYWYRFRHGMEIESVFQVWKKPKAPAPIVPIPNNIPVAPKPTPAE